MLALQIAKKHPYPVPGFDMNSLLSPTKNPVRRLSSFTHEDMVMCSGRLRVVLDTAKMQRVFTFVVFLIVLFLGFLRQGFFV